METPREKVGGRGHLETCTLELGGGGEGCKNETRFGPKKTILWA